ncbi:MAG: right-handed parallel beta-helix repeat-containing protein [Akkermansiaceae bacterium]|nr:right-handed parallel beta-helix repeat-containing protein [Akkermansiaceae bacterium]
MPAALAFAAGWASGAEWHVSPAGDDDANTGSQALPWRSIQRAADAVNPGDTVKVHTGVYEEKVFIERSGTTGNPIVFEPADGEFPIIDGTNLAPTAAEAALMEIYNASHVTIRGFELRNFGTAAANRTPVALYVSGTCAGIVLEDNEIHHIATTEPNGDGNAHGLAVYGDTTAGVTNLIIRGNHVHDLTLGNSEALVINGNVNGFEVSDNHVHHCDNIGIDLIGFEDTAPTAALDQARNGVVSDNLVHDIDSLANPAYGERAAGGIYIDGARDLIVERNRVHHCNIGVEVASEHAGKSASNIVARDNLLYLNHLGGLFTGGYDTGRGFIDALTFEHNTLWRNDTDETGSGEILLQFDVRNSVFKHNLVVTGPRALAIGNPFTQNSNNLVDYNYYAHPDGGAGVAFQWKDVDYGPMDSPPADIAGGDFFAVGDETSAKLTDPVTTEDFRPLPGSPAIDAGDPAFLPGPVETDFDGEPRTIGGVTDLGAHELNPSGTLPPPGDFQLTTPNDPPDSAPLTWTIAIMDHTGFELQRAEGTGGTFATIATLSPATFAYEDEAVRAGVAYRYRIRTVRGVDRSIFSSEVAFTAAARAGAAKTTFTGLWAPANAADGLRGLFAFSMDANLKVTGSLVSGRARHRLAGQFDNAGGFTAEVTRTGSAPLQVNLTLDLNSPDLPFAGTVSDGSTTADAAGGAVAGSGHGLAPQHTVALEPDSGASLPLAPGYGHLAIGGTGGGKLSLRLPDGRSVVQAGPVTRDGRFFVCLFPYRGGNDSGWLSGTATVSDDGTNDIHGPFQWTKAAIATERYYPGGFSGGAGLVGSVYTKPAAGARVLPLAGTDPNVLATFGPADLAPGPGDSAFFLDERNRAVFPAEAGLTLGTSAGNGRFSGSFTDYSGSRARRRGFGGVWLQRQSRGAGHYPGVTEAGAAELLPFDAGRIAIDFPMTLAGTVSNLLSLTPAAANGPVAWGIDGAPPPGVVWNAGTHTLEGAPLAPGTWWVTLWTEDAAGVRSGQRLRIVVDSLFEKTAGAYWGLAAEAPAVHATSALFRLSLSKRGSFSGYVVLGGRRSAFRGAFDAVTGTATIEARRRGNTPLQLSLAMDDAGVGSSLSGTLTAALSTLTPAVDAILSAKRTPWSRGNPAPAAGRFTAVLPSLTGSGLPRGHGYGAMSIGKTGTVAISGRMGDLTPFKSATGLSGDEDFPFFASLSRGAGSARGWVTLRDLVPSDADGVLDWEMAGDFAGTVDFLACEYVAPPRGTRVIPLPDADANGRATFDDAGLVPAPADWVFTLDTLNRARSADGNKAHGLGISTRTGLFSGFFPRAIGGKTVRILYRGAILQKQALGAGQFDGNGTPGWVEWGENTGP